MDVLQRSIAMTKFSVCVRVSEEISKSKIEGDGKRVRCRNGSLCSKGVLFDVVCKNHCVLVSDPQKLTNVLE